MEKLKVPLAKPRPDCDEFMKAVTTDYEPARPRLVEYKMNLPVQKAIIEMLGRTWVDDVAPGHIASGQPAGAGREAFWDNFIAMWYHLGYDFVRLELSLDCPRSSRTGGDHGRAYAETAAGPIQSWEDLEKYPWPDVSEADFFPYEYVSEHMPEGMGMMCCHAGGPLEWLNSLMGYETLCLALYEQPDLVAAVAEEVGARVTKYVERLLQMPRLIAYFQGDDMGFRTGTLLSPEHLRTYSLPHHTRYSAMAHEAGVPYFLHSCGQVTEIMDDLIDTVRIDAKHSVEDAILPVQEWKRRYGGRIGILGGVDIDKLTRLSPEALRTYVRTIIDDCSPGGHFAIGSGNSIPDYIPVENYLTMLDEALR